MPRACGRGVRAVGWLREEGGRKGRRVAHFATHCSAIGSEGSSNRSASPKPSQQYTVPCCWPLRERVSPRAAHGTASLPSQDEN